jgi:integrase
MALTDTQIRNAKPGEKVIKLSDGGGLQLWIMPNGSKLWNLAYRDLTQKQRKLSFGAYPGLSLSDARKKRDDAKALLASGIDPSQQKRLDKLTKAISDATTFKAVAEEYLDKMRREGRAEATLTKTEWLLSMAYPLIGDRPIAEIKAPEILAALKKVEARGILESAHRLRSVIGTVFRYAIATARAESDPSAHLKGALTARQPKNRAAIIDPVRFGELLRAIDGFYGQPTTKAALKLLALVFTRPGELRLAEWTEFDFDKAVWTISAGRMKMRREHKVPLSRQAVTILRELQRFTGEGRFLFPGTRSAMRPISDGTLNAALRRLGYDKEDVCAHGFRATASTLLNECRKFSPDAIERALAHEEEDDVRKAYSRGAYWDERVEMAQWWADHLDVLRKGADVIELRRTRIDL